MNPSITTPEHYESQQSISQQRDLLAPTKEKGPGNPSELPTVGNSVGGNALFSVRHLLNVVFYHAQVGAVVRLNEPEHYDAQVAPIPFILQPAPYTLHPAPCTLHLTPYTQHPTLNTLPLTLYTLHPEP